MLKLIKFILENRKKIYVFTLIGCIGAAFAMCVILEIKQTYTASVKIELSSLNTHNGKMPDNNEFDTNEFISNDVLNAVIDDLELDLSTDELRSGFKVSEYLEPDDADMKNAMIQDAQEYTKKTNTYTVSYTGKTRHEKEQVQQIINSFIYQYQKWYKVHYLGAFKMTDDSANIKDGYDYEWITAVDVLSDELDGLKEYSDAKAEWEGSFRSVNTGMTFSEISTEITSLQSVYINKLYGCIYQGKYCKDQPLLMQYYQTELESEAISQSEYNEQAEKTKELMDLYADKLTTMDQGVGLDSDSTDSSRMILSEVEERYQNTGNIKVDTTYDSLMDQYMEYRIDAAKSQSKIDHYNMILGLFGSDATFSDYTGIDVSDCQAQDTEWLTETLTNASSEISYLFEKLHQTAEDYLEVQVGEKVVIKNITYVYANLNVKLYGIIAIIFCIGAYLSVVVVIKFLDELAKRGELDKSEKSIVYNVQP